MPEMVLLKDIGVNEFCSVEWPPTRDSTFLRAGKGDGIIVPLYDCTGCPMLARNVSAEVYPVPKEEGLRIFKYNSGFTEVSAYERDLLFGK